MGDGFLYWLSWAGDPGRRRLVEGALLAILLLLLAAVHRHRGWRVLAPAARIVDLLGRWQAVVPAVALAFLPQIVVRIVRPDATGRPSILVVLLDTVRLDHTGWGGCPLPTTPRLDALARRGVYFTQAIPQASWTKPSVASLLTGLIPSRHLAVGRPGAGYYPVLPEDRRTLAEAFAVAGYRTAAISTNPNIAWLFGFSQGFEDWQEDASWNAEEVAAAAREWVAARAGEPFFLYLHFNDAHYPYTPPEGFRGRFDHTGSTAVLNGTTEREFREGRREFSPEDVEHLRLSYAEEIAWLDDVVGRLVEDLLAERDDLLVVVVADHGEEFLEHGDVGHGHTLYDELLRVPLQFAWSPSLGKALGLRPGGVDAQVRLVDVAPTLLELAGLSWPPAAPAMDGASLLPALRGEPLEDRPAFAETDSRGSLRSGLPGPLRAWREPELKLVLTDPFSDAGGRYWLFDLVADPGETRNLAGKRFDLLQDRLRRLRKSGWLLEKAPVPPASIQFSPEMARNLAELGYIDAAGPAGGAGRELPLAPGAVRWMTWEEAEKAAGAAQR